MRTEYKINDVVIVQSNLYDSCKDSPVIGLIVGNNSEWYTYILIRTLSNNKIEQDLLFTRDEIIVNLGPL